MSRFCVWCTNEFDPGPTGRTLCGRCYEERDRNVSIAYLIAVENVLTNLAEGLLTATGAVRIIDRYTREARNTLGVTREPHSTTAEAPQPCRTLCSDAAGTCVPECPHFKP